jgi:ribulose-phosphate 3-epimerase
MRNYQIAPSLLSADFARLGEEAQRVINAGADLLHLDAMDNHFVPNLTMGPLVCEALRRYGIQAEINVHLMTQPIDRLIVDFAKSGATSITFHPEASEHTSYSLDLIHKNGCRAGIALKPETSINCLDSILDKIDIIIVMSVNPGISGQTFIPASLEKIRRVKNLISASHRDICLAVDGGIKISNIAQVAQAGADRFIAGSAIFNQSDYAKVISEMRMQLANVKL